MITNGEVARGSLDDGKAMRMVAYHRWWSVAVALVLLLTLAAVGMPTLWSLLHSQWAGVAMYEHGYLVAAMAAWLAWRSVREHAPATLAPDWIFAVPLLAVLALLTLLELLYLNVPRVFLVPPLLVALAGLVFGRAVARCVFWPALLLYGALPIWTGLTGFLQWLTTTVVSTALGAAGIPVFIEGNFVHLAAGTFEVAEDCSGLRYLAVATTLGAFYALAFLPTWRRRGAMLAASVVTALVCNWVRVYVIVLAGHLTNMQHYLVKTDHLVFGWVLFGAFLVPLLFVARRLEGEPEPRARAFAPAIHARGVVAAAAVASSLLVVPELVAVAVAKPGSASAGAAAAVPSGARVDSPWRPVFAHALERHEIVASLGPAIEIYRAEYPWQDAEHRLIAYGNTFLLKAWRATDAATVRTEIAARPLEVNEFEGYLDGHRRIIWAWYWVAGESATGPLRAKWLELSGLFRGRRDAAAVALSAECDVDCGDARRALSALLRQPPVLLLADVSASHHQ